MLNYSKTSKILYPDGKDFIFTVFDDTDVATLESVKPLYELLTNLGFRTTKSVWPLACSVECDNSGAQTLQDHNYKAFLGELKSRGFEIAHHGATMITSKREDTQRSLEFYHEIFGEYPKSYASHAKNIENIYWGEDRFTIPFVRMIYRFLSKEKKNYYSGHRKDSPYFWGDLCQDKIKYVRNYTYNDINLLNITNDILFQDDKKPFVNCFFITSDADNINEFNRLLSIENQEKLERERGICIITTHFGKGFVENDQVVEATKIALEEMSRRNGWFVPVSDVLDFLYSTQGCKKLTFKDRFLLEMKWLYHSFLRSRNSLSYEKTELNYLNKE